MSGYTIFDHAQYGHCEHQGKPKAPDHYQQHQDRPKRKRVERGWAVELGLGLGPQFNRRKKQP